MKNLLKALIWKYGHVCGLRQKDPDDMSEHPKMEIVDWEHETEPQPTKEELTLLITEYEEYLDGINQEKENRESAKKELKEKNKDIAVDDWPDKDVLDYVKHIIKDEIAQSKDLETGTGT